MLKKILTFLVNILKFHKLKIATVFISFFFCLFFLFPFGDLNDLVTEKIAEISERKVYVAFEDLNLSIFPTPGIQMSNVKLDITPMPTIDVGSLKLAPSIASLLTFKLGFVSHAKGLMGGDVDFVFKPGTKTDKIQKYDINFKAQKLELSQIKKFFKIPISPKGSIQIQLSAEIDQTFSEQPEGEGNVSSQQIIIPSTYVPTPMGELPLPEMIFNNVNFKGRISNGELIIEQLDLGNQKDPLSLSAKGRLGLQIIPGLNGGFVTSPGTYELKLQISSKNSDSPDLKLFLGFLDGFKSTVGDKNLYTLRIKGVDFNSPPQMTKLNTFD